MSDLLIFLNPHAGRGGETEGAALQEAFEAAGARVQIVSVPGHDCEKRMREAVAAGAEFIGAAGGDGTISAAANALAGSDSKLLPIPMGTLNHFSKRHGIFTVEDALIAWSARESIPIAVGVMNDRVFVNNASCGFYPHVVRHRDRMEKILPRVPAMWLAGFRVLFEFPVMRLDIKFNDRHEQVRTPVLWIGIGRNSLRLPEHDEAAVEGSVLEIVTGHASTRRGIVRLGGRLLWHLKKGLQPQDAHLDVWRAREFIVGANHKIDVALDGEAHRLQGPLRFEFREAHLNVLSLVTPTSL